MLFLLRNLRTLTRSAVVREAAGAGGPSTSAQATFRDTAVPVSGRQSPGLELGLAYAKIWTGQRSRDAMLTLVDRQNILRD